MGRWFWIHSTVARTSSRKTMIRVTLMLLCGLRMLSGWIFDFPAPGRWTVIQYLFCQPKHTGHVPDVYFNTVEAQTVGKPRLPHFRIFYRQYYRFGSLHNSFGWNTILLLLRARNFWEDVSQKFCESVPKVFYDHPKLAQSTEKCCPKGNDHKWYRATIWWCPGSSGFSFLNEKNFWDTSQLFFFEYERCWCRPWCLGTTMYQEYITLLIG